MITTGLPAVEELYQAEGEAEIIDRVVVFFPLSGRKPTSAAEGAVRGWTMPVDDLFQP